MPDCEGSETVFFTSVSGKMGTLDQFGSRMNSDRKQAMFWEGVGP